MTPAPAGVDIEAAFEEVERIALGLERELNHAQRRAVEFASANLTLKQRLEALRLRVADLEDRRDELLADRARLEHALRRIAETDYRGPEPRAVRIAREALR